MTVVGCCLLIYLGAGIGWAFLYGQAMIRAARGEPKDDPNIEEAQRLVQEKHREIPLTLLLIIVAWPYFRYAHQSAN